MKYVIIGTAGHVDHGKTALIKALSGTDTDRLKEEKARGISIDLGFASLALGADIVAGIVDVPGHERFLKNMLAGTGGIDLVLLVIAADEGVMPQTREHLAMLELYGVRSGVVAVNKIDKVDGDWLDLVEEEIGGVLAGTFLADAPRCPVSAVSGAGLPELRAALLTAASGVPARDSRAPFRLWIDRAFTVKGHGAVVTGSALSGRLAVGDILRLDPGGEQVRIRGLETHGRKTEIIIAGQRAAVNLGGVATENLARGMALSATERGQASAVWDAAADWCADVAAGARIRLHLGTGEYIGRLHYFKDQPPGLARLLLEQPVAAGLGDRGIVRLYSPQHLLGGVTLLAPGKNSRRLGESRQVLAQAMRDGDWPLVVESLIADAGQPVQADDISRAAGYARQSILDDALGIALASARVIRLGEYYLTAGGLAGLADKLVKSLDAHHHDHPDRPGLAKEIVRQRLGVKDRPFDVLLDNWQSGGLIAVSGADVALSDFASKHGDWRRELAIRAEAVLADTGLGGVDLRTLADKLGVPADKIRAAQDQLIRQGELVKIGDILVYRKTIQNIAGRIQKYFHEHSTLTVAEFRDLLATSRKTALPLLEYYDLHKYTIRDGDVRRPGPKLRNLSE